MTNRAMATRYARALFDVALKEADVAQVGEQLHGFRDVVAGHADLSRVLVNPAVPAKMKHAMVGQLAERAGLAAPLRKLLLLLADRDALGMLDDLDTAYAARLRQHQRVVEAQVTTAVPLPADRASALAASLAEQTGREVRLSARVDPSIIGGVVARIGSTVYDGSVARHLERLRTQLGQEG